MTAPAPLAFPGSRNLATWWRQLAERQPRAFWFGHLLLHRIEALVERALTAEVDPLSRGILKALTLFPGEGLTALDRKLHLGTQTLRPLLRQLGAEGLAQVGGDGWTLTPLGKQASERGHYDRTVNQRCVFYFRAHEQSGVAPHFLHLEQPPTSPWAADASWSFEVASLQQCLAQSAEWKQRHHFPLEVERLHSLSGDGPGAAPAWQRVLFDRPERLTALLLLNSAGDQLQGFTVKPDNWTLQTERPLFALSTGLQEVFPELAEPPSAEDWRAAWREWCQPRGLTALVDEATRFHAQGHLLEVTVSRRLLERMRTTRSDALRDEAWLLAGSGRLRVAALLKIVEADSVLPPS